VAIGRVGRLKEQHEASAGAEEEDQVIFIVIHTFILHMSQLITILVYI
jgi:hypothetical protein